MGINRKFFIKTEQIEWDGQVPCTVRGITPDDIALVLNENKADMETLFEMFERNKSFSGAALGDPDIAQALQANQSKMISAMLTQVPDLVAKIIAVAANETDDIDAASEHIRANFVAPLQVEILGAIMRLSFVNGSGFKAFLGNVAGLVGNFRDDQTPTRAAEPLTNSPVAMAG